MARIFFYGLFMDRSLLAEKGLHPEVVGPAVLWDYRIHIGDRATLVPAAGSRAYGVVMRLPADEAHSLYSEPSVREYEPAEVRVRLLDTDEMVDADCYNLPPRAAHAGANPAYAAKLAALVRALGLDPGYADEVAGFGGVA